jgi:hypothetical protein
MCAHLYRGQFTLRATEHKGSLQLKDHAKLPCIIFQYPKGWQHSYNIAALVSSELTAIHFLGLGQARSCHQIASIWLHINEDLCGAAPAD